MGSDYPATLDSFPTDRADDTEMAANHAADHDDLADAVNKIEATLGVNPQGSSDTVAERLESGGSQPLFVQSDDPGAVGAGAIWVNTDDEPATIKIRNADDDGWVDVDLDYVLKKGQNAGGQRMQNLADGVDPQDAATVAQLADPIRIFGGTGDPVAPVNADFKVKRVSSNTSGTFKLQFRSQTTTALAYNATGTEIADALAALSTIGSGNIIPYPGQETRTPNTSSDGTKPVFVGDLGCQPVESPTVVEDTTDNGIAVSDHAVGAPGTPAAATADGDYYYDSAGTRLWVLAATPIASSLATQWLLAGFLGGRITNSLTVGDDPGGVDPTYVQIQPDGSFSAVAAGQGVMNASSGGSALGVPLQVHVPASFSFGFPAVFWLYATLGALADNPAWWIGTHGHEVSAANEVPDDSLIQPGQVFSWFDATNGAASFNRKGKTLDGTIVSSSTPMA